MYEVHVIKLTEGCANMYVAHPQRALHICVVIAVQIILQGESTQFHTVALPSSAPSEVATDWLNEGAEEIKTG